MERESEDEKKLIAIKHLKNIIAIEQAHLNNME